MSLVKFIPGYFMLFDAIVNGIFPLISTSDHSLLVYRNAIDFCVLILCSSALLNLFLVLIVFLWSLWGFSIYNIMPSENNESFTFSSLIGYLLFLFLV